jgi:hypothetical protein
VILNLIKTRQLAQRRLVVDRERIRTAAEIRPVSMKKIKAVMTTSVVFWSERIDGREMRILKLEKLPQQRSHAPAEQLDALTAAGSDELTDKGAPRGKDLLQLKDGVERLQAMGSDECLMTSISTN